MSPHRSASSARSADPRSLVGLLAIALLAWTLPGCAFIQEHLASSPPPPPGPAPTELSGGPSPIFDDETRPGAAPPVLGKRDPEPARRDIHPASVSGSPAAADPRKAAPAIGVAGEAGLAPASAGPTEASPKPSMRPAPREGAGADQDDPVEEIFQTLRQKFTAASSRAATDQYAAIERADLESKLIALFFLRDRKKIEDYRDLIRSFRDDSVVNVEVELLKAALYQKVGQADLRDRALERIREATTVSAGALRLAGLSFAREIRGYRAFTPLAATEFAGGEEVLIYGEIEGFRSTPLGGDRPTHRRSFAAELILRDGAGAEIDRRELLRAGQAVEMVVDPSKPVHFWGRYPIPTQLSPGAYRIEIEVQDIEGQRRVKGRLPLRIRS